MKEQNKEKENCFVLIIRIKVHYRERKLENVNPRNYKSGVGRHRNNKNVTWYNCGKKEHFKAKCLELQKQLKKNKKHLVFTILESLYVKENLK